jgi:hypothetical protein
VLPADRALSCARSHAALESLSRPSLNTVGSAVQNAVISGAQ